MLHHHEPGLWTPPKGIILPPKGLKRPTRRAMQDWGAVPYPGATPWNDPCVPLVANTATAFDFAFVTSAVDPTNLTTYTFSSQSIGIEDSTRYIIVGAFGQVNASQTIDAITVQGLTGSEVVTAQTGAARVSIWIIAVPTGTTGDVVVTFSASGQSNCGVGVYRMVGAISSTATATATDITASSNAFSASLTIPTGGAGLGIAGVQAATDRTFTWTNLSENFDQFVQTGLSTFTGAMSTTAGAATRTVTASGSFNAGALALAAWN